jgi:hypothetical protein
VTDLIAHPGLAPGDTDHEDGHVQEIVQQLKSDFEPRNALYRRIEQVVNREIPVRIPKNYRKSATETHSPLAEHIVNTVTAALTVNGPQTQRKPIGFGDRYVEDATKLEHFHDASWLQQEEDADRELFRLFVASMVTKGEGILKTVERCNRAWSGYGLFQANLTARLASERISQKARDEEYDKRTEEWKARQETFPIGSTDVLPETFYYLKGEEGPTFFAEVTRVPYMDALARLLDGKGRHKYGIDGDGRIVPAAAGLPQSDWGNVMRGERFVSCTEAYTSTHMYLYLVGPGQQPRQSNRYGSGTLVKKIPHRYGNPDTRTLRGPYFHALGITSASRVPHKAGTGIITPFLDLFPQLDALLTQYGNAAYLTGWAAYKTNRPAQVTPALPADPLGEDGLNRRRNQSRTLEPGEVWPDDISALDHPGVGPAFKEFMGIIRGLLDLALPAVVQGVVEGDPSGYALNQAAHLARLAWDPIVKNAQKALSRRTGFEAYLIANCIGERVYAWGEQTGKGRKQKGSRGVALSVDPEDYGGVYKFKVNLDPELPANKQMDLRAHQTMLELRLETPEMAIEDIGHNADEVEQGWLLYDFKQDPEVKGQVITRAKQLLGILRQQQEQEAAGAMAVLDQMNGASTVQPGMEAVGAVPQPGFGMPETPPPPAGASAVQLRGSMGTPAGSPGGLPATHQPLPGGP